MIPPPIRPDERSTELHPYSPGPCTSLSPGGWPPILDLPIFKKIPGSIWFSIKVILFLFLYIWVRAAFPRYRYDQLMGLGRKVFLPLSLARVVPVSGVLVTFQRPTPGAYMSRVSKRRAPSLLRRSADGLPFLLLSSPLFLT